MPPAEMAQGRRRKRGPTELEDTPQDLLRGKQEEIRGVKEELRGVKEEIRGVKEEIRGVKEERTVVKEAIREVKEEIRGVEEEIRNASGTGVEILAAKMEFLRQGMSNLWRELGSRDAEISSGVTEISSHVAEIRSRDAEISILRQEAHELWSLQIASTVAKLDNSEHWSEVMLRGEEPGLPKDADELKAILFPTQSTQTKRLPVTEELYTRWEGERPIVTDKFLVRADGSRFCVKVSDILQEKIVIDSEVDVTAFSGLCMKQFFGALDDWNPHSFNPKVLLNRVESSVTGSTVKGTRPDTLIMASECTFLVGEDKKSDLLSAYEDVCNKVQPLSQVFYGPVRFMLGYAAAGTEFQWLFIDHSSVVSRVHPPLNLSLGIDRCLFLLSLGYAFKLIKRMAESVPNLPGRRAMFAREMNNTGDRILDWSYDSVTKTIIDFPGHLVASLGTSLELIKQAYEAGKKCKFLARAREEPRVNRAKYIVKIGPLGCHFKLENERDGKKFAQHVCKALSALHKEGLVHRDVRLPNIVKVLEPLGEEYHFMLIDMETVARADFLLPEGFHYFRFWTEDTLEGNKYTPRSDMHHLGKILDSAMGPLASPVAKEFIRELIGKKLDAGTALGHHWLAPVGPS